MFWGFVFFACFCRGMIISRANDANKHDETLVLNFTHELLESFRF